MKRSSLILLFLILATNATSPAQTPAPASADFSKKVETYMRELFAWGPNISVKIGAPIASAMPGLLQVGVEVSLEGQTNTGTVFATPDARFIVRGELHDTSTDPFAANRAHIKIVNAPFKGPANAKVTIVEFADFQCPSCKQMHDILDEVLPRYPQVKLVYKDFPLTQIHPWAMTAALAGRCAYGHSSGAFWKVHDAFYTQQGLIGAADAWDKSLEFGKAAGIDEMSFKACLVAPETKTIVEASVEEAKALNIANTPTAFVNGRRIVGPDAQLLEQFLKYELDKTRGPAPASPPAKRP